MEFSVMSSTTSALQSANPTKIKIIGCGGGGSSAINRMIESGVSDVDFVVLNTDLQALNKSPAQTRIPIGQKLTGGLGAGGVPQIGEDAALEDAETISNVVKGTDMVIITAGMGGGTGTGSAPVVARLAREAGALTVAVVTTPFEFERSIRMNNAKEGIAKLRENVDSLIIIPNEQVIKSLEHGQNKGMSFKQAFAMADEVLCKGVQGISDIITKPGAVNCDFNDIKSVMKGKGEALLGFGWGEGENRALDAATMAISNPLLENRQIDGATNVLINITASEDIQMQEVMDMVNTVTASADENTQVFWGQVVNNDIGDKVSITVIATGFDDKNKTSASVLAEEKEEDDGDVISYGGFEDVLSGESLFSSREASVKLSDENLSSSREVAEQAKPLVQNESSSLKSSSSAPSRTDLKNLNADDINTPACLRRGRTLSRSINLSDE